MNAFVIKGQIPTIAATVPRHIPGEYHLEDDKRLREKNIFFLIFQIWKIILTSSERFVYDTAEEDNLSQRLIGGSSAH